MHQTPQTAIDRRDHIWVKVSERNQEEEILKEYHKCVLCGGITEEPPPFPSPADFLPTSYQLPLTDGERELARRSIKT